MMVQPEAQWEAGLVISPDDSISDAVRKMALVFRNAKLETPDFDARQLAQWVFQTDAAGLMLSGPRQVNVQAERLIEVSRRRLSREPVSRIVGSRGFWGREFKISPATLDPRPDTETIVSAVLTLVEESGLTNKQIRILDIGTGSGCILISLLAELPLATGLGTDISAEALETAKLNAAQIGVSDRMQVQLARSGAVSGAPFDVVVSNPPYIRRGDIESLDADVRRYDPADALDGGTDGLEVYREVLPTLSELAPSGWCVFEVGYDQAEAVADLAKRYCGSEIAVRGFKDLGGHTRCVAWKTLD